MITDLGHAAFRVKDVQKTLDFYALLGVEEAFRLHHDDGSLMLVYLHVSGDRFIEVFPGNDAPGEGARNDDGRSFMHLCLLVDDLEAAVDDLRGRGVSIESEPKLGLDGNWQAWIRDPDGNDIELMRLSEDSPQRKAANSRRA